MELLSVQSISILYSYWEEFIQNSFGTYARYINDQNIKIQELSDDIMLWYMENKFKNIRQYSDKKHKRIKLFKDLSLFYCSSDYVEMPTIVNTESNVGFDVLNRLLETFSLEKFDESWGEYNYRTETLKNRMKTFLRYRNGVAHGGDISNEEKVTQEVYNKYRKMISDLMYEIRDRFLYGLKNETYRSKK